MANWDDIEFQAGQTDYVARLNALLTRAEAIATEVEDGRGGQASLAAIVALLVRSTGLTQNLNFAGFRGISAADPQQPQDVATRGWVLANLTVGGDPSGVAITGLNIGSLAEGQVVTRSASAVIGRTIAPGSARVTVSVSAGAITIDVPANAFPSLGVANTWFAPQTVAGSEPEWGLIQTNAPVDEKRWRLIAARGILYLQATSDDISVTSNVFFIQRSGSTLVSISFGTRVNDNLGDLRAIPLRTSNAATNITTDDRGGTVNKTDTSSPPWTIRTDANGGYAAFGNMSVLLCNDASSGNVTVQPESGVTLTAGTAVGAFTLLPGESRLAQRIAANTWRLR